MAASCIAHCVVVFHLFGVTLVWFCTWLFGVAPVGALCVFALHWFAPVTLDTRTVTCSLHARSGNWAQWNNIWWWWWWWWCQLLSMVHCWKQGLGSHIRYILMWTKLFNKKEKGRFQRQGNDFSMKMQNVCLKSSKYALSGLYIHSSICPTSPPIAYMCSACRNPI